MRFTFIISIIFSAIQLQGQGIEPSQIQGASKLNQILQAKSMYIDEYGDTLYIYQHTDFSTAIGADSIYITNDTILLRDGVGFVKLPDLGGVDSIYLSNDTIYLRDGDGFVVMSGGGDGNATDEIQDLYPYNTGFVLSNPTVPLQDTVLFQWTNSIVTPYPEGCDCSVEEIPTLTTRLSQKADSAHLHYISDVIGLTGALDDKAEIGHTHLIENVGGLQSALDGKENSFAKGNLIQGTNVTLSGTLTNRLVGSGDVTISATGGGGSLTIEESVGGSVNLSTTNATLRSLTLSAGTWKVDGIITLLENQAVNKTVTVEIFNSTAGGSALASTAQYITSGSEFNVAITKRVILTTTSTIIIRARTSNGNAAATSTVMTAIK